MSGSDRESGSKSLAALLGAFVPSVSTAAIYVAVFFAIRGFSKTFYAPRTFLGTVPEKDRTPSSRAKGTAWLRDFRTLPDSFVLQHNSLDAFLFLRFLKFTTLLCAIGTCITLPILWPIHATGGGRSTQLDRFSFSNVAKKEYLWAHVVLSWILFGTFLALVVRERLHLVGTRQAYLLDETRAVKLSSRTVLFLNVPREVLDVEDLQKHFGPDAEHGWPVKDALDLDSLVSKRNIAAIKLEDAQFDLIKAALQRHRKASAQEDAARSAEQEALLPAVPSVLQQFVPLSRNLDEKIGRARESVVDTAEEIDRRRTGWTELPNTCDIFVSFSSQQAAHRAYQTASLDPKLPVKARFLNVRPQEVIWSNLGVSIGARASKASLGLVFVLGFIVFYSIPSTLVSTLSNIGFLAENVEWLGWINRLPGPIVALLSGLVPPLLSSWFQSYVPTLFRHVAKYSGEPTRAQAELKTQAWVFVFQVVQIFLVTTFSSGAAAVAWRTLQDPLAAPDLLAEALPKASNFYLTYFILQGTVSAASSLLNWTDLVEYWFLEYYWEKTPRQKFTHYATMRGMVWGSWYPKFINFFVIAVAYSCIAPLVTGFAAMALFAYYYLYRYNILYVRQCKIDTRGASYQRALKQMVTGIYLSQLCLIGLFGFRNARAQAYVMVGQAILTAFFNLLVDSALGPLELYLGLDTWQQQGVPHLAHEQGISHHDYARLHATSQVRRLGLLPIGIKYGTRLSSFLESIIQHSRESVEKTMHDPAARHVHDGEERQHLSEEEVKTAYVSPAFTSKTPRLWLPRDPLGISRHAIQRNEAAGILSTDDGAEIDEHGRLRWTHDFDKVPIFSRPKDI